MSRRTTRAPGLRAFTLVELIAVVLIIGILAAVAVIGYTQFTQRAQATAAKANLATIASAVLVEHTAEGAPVLTRELFLKALDDASVEVIDSLGQSASPSPWSVYGHDQAPDDQGEFAVAFDDGLGTAADDIDGTRAAVVTSDGDSSYAILIHYGAGSAGTAPTGGGVGEVPNGSAPTDILNDPDLLTPDPGDGGTGGNPGDGDGSGGPGGGSETQGPGDGGPGDGGPGDGAPGDEDGNGVPDDADFSNIFGYSTDTHIARNASDLSGNTFVVTRESLDDGTTDGINYVDVYTQTSTGWKLQQTLSTGVPWDGLGTTVRIDGDDLAVAQVYSGAGKILMYHRTGTTWSLVSTLTAPTADPTEALWGQWMELDGGHLAVGTRHLTSRRGAPGEILIFSNGGSGWTKDYSFSGPTGSPRFGDGLGLDGTTLATFGTEGSTPKLYIYSLGATSATLESSFQITPSWPDNFSVEGDIVVLTDNSTVRTFQRSGGSWSQTTALTDERPASKAYLSGGRLVVSWWNSSTPPEHVELTTYTRSGSAWVEVSQTNAGPGPWTTYPVMGIDGDLMVSAVSTLNFRVDPEYGDVWDWGSSAFMSSQWQTSAWR